jgi:hypothetical protein
LHACIVGQAEFESTKTCEGRPKINTSARKALELPPLAPQSNNSKVTLLGPPSKHENILKHVKNNAQTRILHHHVFDLNLVEQIYEFCKIRILLKSTLSKILPSVVILGVVEKN